jgi:hypothetical protein
VPFMCFHCFRKPYTFKALFLCVVLWMYIFSLFWKALHI